MSELSHKRAQRLIHQRQLSDQESSALRAHLDRCERCRDHALMDKLLRRHLVLDAAGERPVARQSAVFMGRVQRHVRSQKIMKPIYALASIAVIAILAVAGWLVMQPNIEADAVARSTAPATSLPTPEEETAEQVAEPSAADRALIAAVQAGDPAAVATALEAAASPNAPDGEGNSLIAVAAGQGQLEIVQLLLGAGADVDGTMKQSVYKPYPGANVSALQEAIRGDYIAVVELLLENGADVNYASNGGDTALHTAAYNNKVEMVPLLLQHGADTTILTINPDGHTPLTSAVSYGNADAAKALLEGGADVDGKDELGLTTLMRIIDQRVPTDLAEMVALLLEAGADPNTQDNFGNTALHHAARFSKPEAIPLLLEHGAALDIKNNNGQIPLDVSATDEIRQLLLEAGAAE